MQQKLLLTIGIPTYNGEKYIRETLDSVVSQDCSELEILIMDNASTDNTIHIIKEYETKYKFIRHITNSTNIGFDQNFNKVICEANGLFVWILCDDDIVVDGGIAKVLNILKNNPNICNIYVNYSVYNGDITVCKEERATKIYKDVSCTTPDGFYESAKNGNVVASSNIISKELWSNLKKDKFLKSGSGWIHVEGVSIMCIQNPKYHSYCIADPILLLRQGDVKWVKNGGLFLHTITLLPIFKRFKELGYAQKTTDMMVCFIEESMWANIVTSKVSGLNVDKELFMKTWKLMYDFPLRSRIINGILLVIPRGIHKIIYKFLSIMKHGVEKICRRSR